MITKRCLHVIRNNSRTSLLQGHHCQWPTENLKWKATIMKHLRANTWNRTSIIFDSRCYYSLIPTNSYCGLRPDLPREAWWVLEDLCAWDILRQHSELETVWILLQSRLLSDHSLTKLCPCRTEEILDLHSSTLDGGFPAQTARFRVSRAYSPLRMTPRRCYAWRHLFTPPFLCSRLPKIRRHYSVPFAV